MPPFDAKAIANFLLALDEMGHALTPMKLQKLVYFSHGWHLAMLNSALIDENVEAWAFGPVIPSLYHEFKEFGNSPIDRKATEMVWTGMDSLQFKIVTPAIPKDATDSRELTTQISRIYGRFQRRPAFKYDPPNGLALGHDKK